jgi:hypothetical protein
MGIGFERLNMSSLEDSMIGRDSKPSLLLRKKSPLKNYVA